MARATKKSAVGGAKTSAKAQATKRAVKAKANRRATTNGALVSRETLDATPARALSLLRAVGTSRPIMARMKAYGFTAEDAQEGWTLLRAASGFEDESTDDPTPATDARAAFAELDSADETLFRVLNASLSRRLPGFAAKVLTGLTASQGGEVVLTVSTLLDRLDAAFKKPDADAKLAFDLLEQRGYGEAERARLRALTEQAQSVPEVDLSSIKEREQADAALVERLQDLRNWYEEWSQIARAALVRRDFLIRAGLASRREAADAPPVTPSPLPRPALPN